MRPLAGPLQVNIAQPGSQQLNAQLPLVVGTDTPHSQSGPLRNFAAAPQSAAAWMEPAKGDASGEGGGWVVAQSITPPAPPAEPRHEAIARPKRLHKGRFSRPDVI